MEILKTERFILRPYVSSDIDSVHIYASNPEIVKYMLFGPNTYEDTTSFINNIINVLYKEEPIKHLEYAIEFEGEIIGGVSAHIDELNLQAEVGWILNPNYHRKGIVTEAASKLISYIIGKYNLKRIFATCDSRNIASQGVMKKLGMKHNETEDQKRINKRNGVYEFTTYVYEILI